MLGDTVGMSKRAHFAVVGRSGWSINGKFLLVKNQSHFFSGAFFSTFSGDLCTCENPDLESSDISVQVYA